MENFPRMATASEQYELAMIVPLVDIIKGGGRVYAYDRYTNLNDKYETPVFEVSEVLHSSHPAVEAVLQRDGAESTVLIAKNKQLGVLEKMTDWMAETPRAYTEEEIRAKFIKHVWGIIRYWENLPDVPNLHDKMTGLAFSIFSTIDGSSLEVPGFIMTPNAHSTDKGYHIRRGENWFPDDVDIAGSLHEEFHQHDPQKDK